MAAEINTPDWSRVVGDIVDMSTDVFLAPDQLTDVGGRQNYVCGRRFTFHGHSPRFCPQKHAIAEGPHACILKCPELCRAAHSAVSMHSCTIATMVTRRILFQAVSSYIV